MSAITYYSSTIAKKFLTGLTGVLLILFLIVHLGGNLTLFVGRDTFNSYSYHLESLSLLLYIVEIGLLAVFVVHIVTALGVQLGRRRSRPHGYAVYASKGKPSRQTVSSRTMLVTGLALLAFIPWHVWMFKFNQGTPMPMTMLHGREIKDLYVPVVTAFKQPLIAWTYATGMFLLGFHLRHGFWSAFQSLGALHERALPVAYGLGALVAVLLAGGFLVLPLWILYVVPIPGT